MTNIPACEAARLFAEYQQATNDFAAADAAGCKKELQGQLIEGQCASALATRLSNDALDRMALIENAISFAKCNSMDGALILLAMAAQSRAWATERCEPGSHASEEYVRRAERMQVEAARFLKGQGMDQLASGLLSLFEINPGILDRQPIASFAQFQEALQHATA